MSSNKVPVVRQISWVAFLAQLAAVVAVSLGAYALLPIAQADIAVLATLAAITVYLFAARHLIGRHHRRGMRLVHHERWEDAIAAFEESLAFFTRHAWLDRFRALTMLSASAPSYREMALCNIAFCHAQRGDGERARAGYERALEAFPESGLARVSLNVLNAGSAAGALRRADGDGSEKTTPGT